jgi:signal transduction histidine kinase/DNA-binding response OmpR family regulator
LKRGGQWPLIILCITLPLVATGQLAFSINDAVYLDSLDHWFDVADYIALQKDVPESWSIDDIRQNKEGWQPLSEGDAPVWQRNCWLKLVFKNDRIFASALALLLHADEISAWLAWPDSLSEVRLGGNLRPRSVWDSRQHSPIYSSPHTLQFEVPASSEVTVYLKLGATDQHFKLQPKICSQSYFQSLSTRFFSRNIATQSFFHGVMWMMLLFHLLFFGMTRDRAYLFFAAYIFTLSASLFYTFGTHFYTAFAEYPQLSRAALLLCTFGYSYYYPRFLAEFLHKGGWRMDIKYLLRLYARLVLITGVLATVLLFLPVTVFKVTYGYWMLFPFSVIGLSSLTYISVLYWSSGNRMAKYIAANNMFMILGLIVSTVTYFMSTGNWIAIPISRGTGILVLEAFIVLQLLSFSLSLSYRGLEIERERTRLQELDQLKSRFFANISHEFRTPLTLILGPLQQLLAITNQSKERQQLKTAATYAQRLLAMVNQILDLGQLEAGKLELNPVTFDIVELTKAIYFSFQSIAEKQDVELEFKSEKETRMVYLDKGKLEQVLINLIDNAIKYNRPGGRVVLLLKFPKKDQLAIQLKDTGMGIPSASLPYIFQFYYRGPTSRHTQQQASSGLGLTLTKELIELQNGQIKVESKERVGTTFTVTLPLLPVVQKALSEQKIEPASLPQAINWETIPANPNKNESKTSILLIEDHQDLQRYIQSCLQPTYNLWLAEDGEQGLAIARKEVPDLIITDVMMPKMDGLALTQALKQDQITSHIPVIILTGKSSKVSLLEGLKTQVDEYLTKPFDPEELLLRIRNLLENRKQWIAHFQQDTPSDKVVPSLPSMETVFLQKVEALVHANLANEDYGVAQLGRDLRLDRTQLFRKLKALTGQNPSHFIRIIRLQKAYRLLQDRTATVAEIAFQVGFSNPSYFSRSFKAHFNKTPGEVMSANV